MSAASQAVALFSVSLGFLAVENLLVVGLYRGFDVFSTAVRHFNCVPVEDFVEGVVGREVFVN